MKPSNVTSFKIAPTLFLNILTIAAPSLHAPAISGTDRIFVVDVSGSMAGELPALRQHIKTRISVVAEPTDRVSIIAYSGRKQCSRVIEGMDVKDAASLALLHKLIDRWLTPIGLTSFVDPLVMLKELVGDLRKSKPETTIDVAFMTDGQETTGYTRSEILAACDALRDEVDAVTVVEYGMWADRPMLTAMAEHLGGSLVYVNGAAAFAMLTEQIMQRRLKGRGKKVSVDVGAGASLVFSLGDNEVLTYVVDGWKVWAPPAVKDLAVLSSKALGTDVIDLDRAVRSVAQLKVSGGALNEHIAYAYAAVGLLSVRQQPKVMYEILRALGDVALIDTLSICFGKQAYTSAAAMAQAGAFDVGARWVGGFDQSRVPKDDAFTIIDLAKLIKDTGARIDSTAVKFARIGPKQVDSADFFLQREFEEVERLWKKAEGSREVDAFSFLYSRLGQILDTKGVKMVFTPYLTDDGDLVDEVVWNMETSNLGLRLRIPGTIDLRGLVPQDISGRDTLPEQFETRIYRTRPIVVSGIRNIDVLPLFVSEEAWKKLAAEGLVDAAKGYHHRVEIDLAKVPMSNMRMRDSLSAKEVVQLHFDLLAQNGEISALEDARKAFPKENWIVDKHGAECAAWLDKQGIRPYGFSPPKVKHPYKSGDKRDARMMYVKIASFSSLPSIPDTRKRLADIQAAEIEAEKVRRAGKGKAPKIPTLTPSMGLIADGLARIDAYLKSDAYASLGEKSEQDAALKTWLDAELKAAKERADVIRAAIARATFTAIVAQAPFVEFAGQEMADEFPLEATARNGTKLSATIAFETKPLEL
jgi:hypothetical protein